jgi:hypothetical protein
MRRSFVVAALAVLAVLVQPAMTYAWRTISDTAVDVQTVCRDGTRFEVADHAEVATQQERDALPRFFKEPLVIALDPPTDEFGAYTIFPPKSSILADKTLRLKKEHFGFVIEGDDPANVQYREYHRSFTLKWRKSGLLQVGDVVVFSFDRFSPDDPEVDLVYTVADCFLAS